MKEIFRAIEEPRPCPYLSGQTASLEVRAITELNPAEYSRLLARGYRRFGWQLFRPACPCCAECRSLRVLVPQFAFTASDRRVLRSNQAIRAEIHPLFLTSEHVDLYNRYHQFMHEKRGWPIQQATLSSYRDAFLSGATNLGKQWLYFDADRLIGVGFMDQTFDSVSLVYFFHHPEWRRRSPGNFSILTQLSYAKQQNLKYAYLGYWIKDCQSMSYKNRFKPYQILREYGPDREHPIWQ